MGTAKTNRNTKAVKDCEICGKPYSPSCDYRQGRCPHHPSLAQMFMNSVYYTRFLNLVNVLRGKK